MAGELGKRFRCCIPRLGGWESFIRCLSFSHVLKKGQHAAVMDLRVGGFLRLLQVAQLIEILRKHPEICVKSEEIWEIEKRRCKKTMLKTLLYKSLLCDLMIFLTPCTHDLICAYRIRIPHYTHDLISCWFFISSQSIPQSQNITHWIQEHGLQMVAPPKSSSEVREKIGVQEGSTCAIDEQDTEDTNRRRQNDFANLLARKIRRSCRWATLRNSYLVGWPKEFQLL